MPDVPGSAAKGDEATRKGPNIAYGSTTSATCLELPLLHHRMGCIHCVMERSLFCRVLVMTWVRNVVTSRDFEVHAVLPSRPLLLFIVFGAWGRRILPSALLIIGIVDVVSSVVEEGLVSANRWSTMPNLGTKAEYVHAIQDLPGDHQGRGDSAEREGSVNTEHRFSSFDPDA